MRHSRWPSFGWVLALIAGGTLASLSGEPMTDPVERPYAVLDDDLEPFRSAFNDVSGQARAVLLVGPT